MTYPAEWNFARLCVPNLRIPHELFVVANRPIGMVPKNVSQPRPLISDLDRSAMFLWCYYQAGDDPGVTSRADLPDYSRFALPFEYVESEVMPSYEAREWDPADFLWRRLGFQTDSTWLTIWIWEGTKSDLEDVSLVESIVSSVVLS